MPHNSIVFVRSSFSLILPYSIRDISIKTANRQGPARSPIVLETPRADSVNADAHCAIAASDAPAQIISKIISQNSGKLSSFRIDKLSPFSSRRSIGQVIKLKVFTNGISAQISVSIFQFFTPNTAKKSVEPIITPTAPQQ